MGSPEREDSCKIIWDPSELTLKDLTECLSVQLDLYDKVVTPYVTSELYQDGSNAIAPALPLISTVRMSSPLTIELISGSSNIWSVAALGMLAYVLKNPEVLETLGTLDLRIRAARAELQERLRKLQERSHFEARGYPMRTFERAYRSRELRQTRINRNRGRRR